VRSRSTHARASWSLKKRLERRGPMTEMVEAGNHFWRESSDLCDRYIDAAPAHSGRACPCAACASRSPRSAASSSAKSLFEMISEVDQRLAASLHSLQHVRLYSF